MPAKIMIIIPIYVILIHIFLWKVMLHKGKISLIYVPVIIAQVLLIPLIPIVIIILKVTGAWFHTTLYKYLLLNVTQPPSKNTQIMVHISPSILFKKKEKLSTEKPIYNVSVICFCNMLVFV